MPRPVIPDLIRDPGVAGGGLRLPPDPLWFRVKPRTTGSSGEVLVGDRRECLTLGLAKGYHVFIKLERETLDG